MSGVLAVVNCPVSRGVQDGPVPLEPLFCSVWEVQPNSPRRPGNVRCRTGASLELQPTEGGQGRCRIQTNPLPLCCGRVAIRPPAYRRYREYHDGARSQRERWVMMAVTDRHSHSPVPGLSSALGCQGQDRTYFCKIRMKAVMFLVWDADSVRRSASPS